MRDAGSNRRQLDRARIRVLSNLREIVSPVIFREINPDSRKALSLSTSVNESRRAFLMTICASVKVRDGLVLATDSMTQIQGTSEDGTVGVLKTYSNAKKLFRIGLLPIGVMSYGIGNIGKRSIQGFMRDFSWGGADTVRDVTDSLYQYIKTAYDGEFNPLPQEQRPVLGFYVAGYLQNKPFAEEWEFLIPSDTQPREVRDQEEFGASWRGIERPFTRLYHGFDPTIADMLRELGLDDETVRNLLDGLQGAFVFDGMPVQDAINFATFILRTTIGMSTFEAGPPACGGPLQVAVILPDKTFQWVSEHTFKVGD